MFLYADIQIYQYNYLRVNYMDFKLPIIDMVLSLSSAIDLIDHSNKPPQESCLYIIQYCKTNEFLRDGVKGYSSRKPFTRLRGG